jgi:arylsulfatase A-like enzyme
VRCDASYIDEEMMKKTTPGGMSTVWLITLFYAFLAIPIDCLISFLSNPAGAVPSLRIGLRSCGLIMVTVFFFVAAIYLIITKLGRFKGIPLQTPLQQAILMGAGAFIILFFLLFDRYYDKFQALIMVELADGGASAALVWIAYRVLRKNNRAQRLTAVNRRMTVVGVFLIVAFFSASFVGSGETASAKKSNVGSPVTDKPNILFIVMDTVRADHLSLYGYPLKTTPFLEKLAEESAVFNNAFAAAPWTLPSHASLFTGLYPSQHRANSEHFWLDDSYRTLAEILHDHGYQTVSFSNNDYVSAYHNLMQGFERTWYKGAWADNASTASLGLGKSIVSFYDWGRQEIRTRILSKIIENPAAIWDYPKAAVTNKAIVQWLRRDSDDTRPFFMFVNYMDAHLPYNPDDKTARLFLDAKTLKASYKLKLRFPPIEYCLDLSKGGYSQNDLQIMTTLYDACLRYLDGQLERLFGKLKDLGLYDKTLIVVTSDHGEYLGSRNRLAHGLDLHEQLLHIPLLIRYPGVFMPGRRYDTVVTHVDIPNTILSFAKIEERPKGMPATQVLYDLKKDVRPYVFSEVHFPLHLFVNAHLREDNSSLFLEEKSIQSQENQLIWKSRGEPEFYNLVQDPSEHTDLYAKSKEEQKIKVMRQELTRWAKSVQTRLTLTSGNPAASEKQSKELLDRLRAIGYVNN